MAEKYIRTQYEDGTVVLSNLRKKRNTVPVFGSNETYSATKVTQWYDGTAMTPEKADGSVYLQLKETDEYFRVNLPNWGETFLGKDTMAQMRALTPTEILLLKAGYYKGVKLNGYYAKGDTPAAIDYYISSTSAEDDGGSVIDVGGVKLEHEFVGGLNILYFGAVGDGIFNNDDVFVKSFAYFNTISTNFTIIIPKDKVFKFTLPITMDNVNGNFISEGELLYTGTKANGVVALTLGKPNDIFVNKEIRVNINSNVGVDYINSTGVEIINAQQCDIYLDSIRGFYKGVVLLADGAGVVYNTIKVLTIQGNGIGLELTNDNSGWCNENIIIGGRFSAYGQYNKGKKRIGVLITSRSNYTNNANYFLKNSFEMASNGAAPERAIGIRIEYGAFNKFESVRNEGNSPVFAEVVGTSKDNTISTLWGLASVLVVEDLSDSKNTLVYTQNSHITNNKYSTILSIDNILDYVSQYNNTSIYIGKLFKFISSSTGISLDTSTTSSFTKEGLTIGSNVALSVRIDTRENKKIVVELLNSIPEGRIGARCLDSDMNILHDTTKHYCNLTPFSFYGGAYLMGANFSTINGKSYISVSDEVKYVDVLIYNSTVLKGLNIYAVDKNTSVVFWKNSNKLAQIKPTNIDNIESGEVYYNSNNNNPEVGWIYINNEWRSIISSSNTASIANKGLVNQSAKVDDVSTTPPSPLSAQTVTTIEEAQTAVNNLVTMVNAMQANEVELKVKLNSKLSVDRASGQQSTT